MNWLTIAAMGVDSQKTDWKPHKAVCMKYAFEKATNFTGLYIGKDGKKAKPGSNKRTRGDILRDLSAYASSHNGDSLSYAAWNLLELTKDISRAQTHFLAVTLRRTESTVPRTYYTLVEAEALPWSVLDTIYANRERFDETMPVSPRKMVENDAKLRIQNHGALGSVMVISIELPNGNCRPPREALGELVIHIFQPLGLFNEHKASLQRVPTLSKANYIKCLDNALKGGMYAPVFFPYVEST